MIEIDLSGKTAIITGGSKGIGKGVSKILSQAGAKISIISTQGCSKDLVREIRSEGEKILNIIADVSDFLQIQKAAEKVVKEYGSIDILVTSAGTTSVSPIEKMELSEWERILKINLTGTFNSVKSVLPYMIKQKKGVITFIGSAVIVSGGGGGAHYASSKSGLEGLNRSITKELAPKGIRSNIIHPSLIDTDLLHKRHPDPKVRKQLIKEVPIGRLGKPEDIAYVVSFLSSDLASYITGQSIFVDGGRTFCKK